MESAYNPGDFLSADNVNEWVDRVNTNPPQERTEFGVNYYRWFGANELTGAYPGAGNNLWSQMPNVRFPMQYAQSIGYNDPSTHLMPSPALSLQQPYGDATGFHDIVVPSKDYFAQNRYGGMSSGASYADEPIMISYTPGPEGQQPDPDERETIWGSNDLNNLQRAMVNDKAGYRPLGQRTTRPKNQVAFPGQPADTLAKFVRQREWQTYEYAYQEWRETSYLTSPTAPIINYPLWIPIFFSQQKFCGIGQYYYGVTINAGGTYEIHAKVAPYRAGNTTSSLNIRKLATFTLGKINLRKDGYTGNYIPNKMYPLSEPHKTYLTSTLASGGLGSYNNGEKYINFMYCGDFEQGDIPGIMFDWIDTPPTNSFSIIHGIHSIRDIRQLAS